MPLILVTRNHGRPPTEHPTDTPEPAPGRPWLIRLFAGEVALPPLAPTALTPTDRSPAEADALARALASPDLFVLDAPDRTAREKLLADLVRTAAVGGERVLVLSPDPAAADRFAEAMANGRTVAVVRALADDENPHRQSPTVTRLTAASVGAGRVDQMKREAALAVATLEAKLSRLERSRAAASRAAAVDADRVALARRLELLDAEVRAEADGKPARTPFTETIDRLRADRDAALAPLATDRDKVRVAQTEADAALATARQQLAAATAKPTFFARLLGAKPADASGMQHQIEERERETAGLSERAAKLQAELDAIGARFTAEIEQRIADEVHTKRAANEPRLRELESEFTRVSLSLRDHPPPAAPDDTIRNGTETAYDNRADVERDLAAARDRITEIAKSGIDLARRFLGEAQVVVGTPGSVGSDPALRTGTQFGLLVLDHAEELGEADFARLAPLAGRCVLAGEATCDAPMPHANGHARHARPHEPHLLARLARFLDREPWAIEGSRLVFRLVHLSAAERKSLCREPVLDHPHVELRMAGSDGDPILAEIAFPAVTSIPAAKAFLFTQLGEVLLRPCGECVWNRTEERIAACWPAAETAPGEWIDLEPGVREKVVGNGTAAYTAAIHFDLAAGWEAAQAEAWLAARLPAAPTSRLAVLPRGASPAVSRPLPVA